MSVMGNYTKSITKVMIMLTIIMDPKKCIYNEISSLLIRFTLKMAKYK